MSAIQRLAQTDTRVTARGLIVAAPSSGSGKTVITLGLVAVLRAQGVRVAALKAGPDYIDPVFHASATGCACYNLDPWAMRAETMSAVAAGAARGALEAADDNTDGASALVVCEGVMGLFDGATPDTGSSADIARLSGWPVVLVVDAHAQGASAAAQVMGFARFQNDISIAGVIFNRVGSAKHQRIIRHAMACALPEVPVLGMVPRESGLQMPSRHLGLVQASEYDSLEDMIDHVRTVMARHVDVSAIMALARGWRVAGAAKPLPPLGARIAVARDEAFAFSYPQVLAGWRSQGAEVSFFSPLEDQAPAVDADAVYLPGGYPELHAYRLASAERFMNGVRAAAQRGAFVYGECGGYMVLGRSLRDADGTTHAMAGLLPLGSSFETRKLHLGYRAVTLRGETPLGLARTRFRGHEFHYACITGEGPGEALFETADAEGASLGKKGQIAGRVFGSFVHLIDRYDGS